MFFAIGLNLQYWKHSNIEISYLTWGQGPNALVCFHGYGQSAEVFSFLNEPLGSTHTIFAINWFGNGFTQLPAEAIDKTLFNEVIQHLVQQKTGSPAYSLISFSFGVIPLLSLVQTNTNNIKKCAIISPPGFAFFNLMKFGSNTYFGKHLFKLVIAHQSSFERILNSGFGKIILGKSKVKLLLHFFDKHSKLQNIFNVWQASFLLLPQKDGFNTFGLNQTLLVTSKYDKITPPHLLRNFIIKLGGKEVCLEKGHKLNTQQTVKLLLAFLA